MLQINKEIIKDILTSMPADKKETLKNAMNKNYYHTSEFNLPFITLTVYKEGFYIELKGTRSVFRVYAQDNDGELEITRKPKNLNELYKEEANTWTVIELKEVIA